MSLTADVTVVIPTHNRRGFLEEAVQSCFAGNDAIDVEVIVVDDGSTDDTREYLRLLSKENERVRPFFQEHRGAQVARNRGLDEACGWAIKFLDDDDYLVPGALADQHALLKDSGADVCYGDHKTHFTQQDETRYPFQNDEHSTLFVGVSSTGGIHRGPRIFLYRRDALGETRWDESLSCHQDFAFVLDAASLHLSCCKIDAPVAVKRVHGGKRIKDSRQRISDREKAQLKSEVYWRAYHRLLKHGTMTDELRHAVAGGLWNHARTLGSYSFKAFVHQYKKIITVKPDFLPSRSHSLIEVADRVGSPMSTECLLIPFRKMRRRI